MFNPPKSQPTKVVHVRTRLLPHCMHYHFSHDVTKLFCCSRRASDGRGNFSNSIVSVHDGKVVLALHLKTVCQDIVTVSGGYRFVYKKPNSFSSCFCELIGNCSTGYSLGVDENVYKARLSPAGAHCLTASDAEIKLWDVSTRKDKGSVLWNYPLAPPLVKPVIGLSGCVSIYAVASMRSSTVRVFQLGHHNNWDLWCSLPVRHIALVKTRSDGVICATYSERRISVTGIKPVIIKYCCIYNFWKISSKACIKKIEFESERSVFSEVYDNFPFCMKCIGDRLICIIVLPCSHSLRIFMFDILRKKWIYELVCGLSIKCVKAVSISHDGKVYACVVYDYNSVAIIHWDPFLSGGVRKTVDC